MNKKSLIMVICLTVAGLCLLAIVIGSISRGSGDPNATTQSGNVTTADGEAGTTETTKGNEHGTGLLPDDQSGSQGNSSGIEVEVGNKDSNDYDGEEDVPDNENTPSGGGQQGGTSGNQGGTQTETTTPATGTTEPAAGDEDPTRPSQGGDSNSDKDDDEVDAKIDASQLFG